MESKEIIDVVDKEIVSAIGGLGDLSLDTKEYGEATTSVCKLIEARTKLVETDNKAENQYYDTEIRQQQAENELKHHEEEIALQKKQSKINFWCRVGEIAVAVGTCVAGIVVTVVSQGWAYKFEEKGTITTRQGQDAVRNGTQFFWKKH